MSFDALASHYGWMEFVLAGEKLQRCRTDFLGEVTHCQNILIMGQGHGRFALECRRVLGKASITCVDASARMLAVARRRLEASGLGLRQTEWIHADALAWIPPPGAFDLIVTHFFLDCFRPDQLGRVIAGLANAATSDAAWLLADFQLPASRFRRCRAQLIHWTMYAFFRAVTRLPARKLTAPDGLIQAQNFVLRERRESEWGLLHSDKWERDLTAPPRGFPARSRAGAIVQWRKSPEAGR